MAITRRRRGFQPSLNVRVLAIALLWGGSVYDPSCAQSLFQDSRGTVPVTAPGQPVGLMMDCSYKLQRGAQLAVPLAPNAGWQGAGGGVITFPSAGVMRIAQGWGDSYGQAFLPRSLNIDTLYELKYRVTAAPDVIWTWGITGTNFGWTPGPQEITLFHKPTQDGDQNLYIALDAANPVGAYLEVQLVSLRAVPGRHMLQPSTPSRPLFQRVGRFAYLDFDGVDDSMYSHTEVDYSAARSVTVCAAYARNKDSVNVLLELGPVADTTYGTFYLATRETAESGASFRISSTSGAFDKLYGFGPPLYQPEVVTVQSDFSAPQTRIRMAGVDNATGANISGPSLTKQTLYLGSRLNANNLCFGGQFHGLVITPRFLRNSELALVERWATLRKPDANAAASIAFGSGLLALRSFTDWAGMYQDNLGALPVTAAGQPVGLILDQGAAPLALARGAQIVSDVIAAGMSDAKGGYTQCTTNGGPDPYFGFVYTSPNTSLCRLQVELWASEPMEGRLYVYDGSATIVINELPITITTTPTVFQLVGWVPAGTMVMRVDGPDARGGGSVPPGLVYNVRHLREEFLPGVHWRQDAVQCRAKSKLVAGKRRLNFDGVDDFYGAIGMPSIADQFVLAAAFNQVQHPGQWRTLFDGMDTSNVSTITGVRLQNNADLNELGIGVGRNSNVVASVAAGLIPDGVNTHVLSWWDGSTLGISSPVKDSTYATSDLVPRMKAGSALGGEATVAFYDGDLHGFLLAQGANVAPKREAARRWALQTQE